MFITGRGGVTTLFVNGVGSAENSGDFGSTEAVGPGVGPKGCVNGEGGLKLDWGSGDESRR
jgi:hypothetical protein